MVHKMFEKGRRVAQAVNPLALERNTCRPADSLASAIASTLQVPNNAFRVPIDDCRGSDHVTRAYV